MQELHTIFLQDMPASTLMLYYAIVTVGAFYTLYRFGISKITLLIIFIFWEGLFGYFNESINFIEYYKITIFVFICALFGPCIFSNKFKTDKFVNICFLLFSASFWISCIINNQISLTSASQFFYKFSLPFFFYHGLKDIRYNSHKADFLSRLLLFLVFLQVIFSIIKLALVRGPLEFIVGSIQFMGGGTAVALPILAFFLYFLIKDGTIKGRNWIPVAAFVIIGLASAKRSQIFVFPVVILVTLFLIQKTNRFFSALQYLPIILILFYVGVKTNYTLNPEHSMWGSFDLQYLYSYIMEYNFGTENTGYLFEQTTGRGGALKMLIAPGSLGFNSIGELLFGKGLEDVVLSKYGRFFGEGYGIAHSSLMGESIKILFTLGYAGLISYFLFAFSIIQLISNMKMRLIVLGFFLWEITLYAGAVLLTGSLAFLFVFICLYSNNKLESSPVNNEAK